METPFKVTILKDQLSAQLEPSGTMDHEFSIKADELEEVLSEAKVVFGIDREKLERIAQNPRAIQYPVVVAKGIPAKNGTDAFLEIEYEEKKAKVKKKINFRDVKEIPSVRSGQLIARIVPQTRGTEGKTVTGRVLPPKPGKPLTIRAGKNVVQDGNQFISTIDGQVSITNKMITVNPVYEVKGDLDLKTGNIRFVGNIVVHGNVPTGYELVADGDIKIYGLVEGAYLEAKGNIYVSGGITGANRGKIRSGGNLEAAYLNQTDVIAEQDVIIHSSILHSRVHAGGSILCKNGKIIGGYLSSGKDLYAKEVGNRLYTKTDLKIGHNSLLDEREQVIKNELKKVSENIRKLNEIEGKLLSASKQRREMSDKEKLLILKQRATRDHLGQELSRLNNELLEIEEEKNGTGNCSAFVYGTVYPNTVFHFGKYSKTIQVEHSYVKFFVADGEVVFEPIR